MRGAVGQIAINVGSLAQGRQFYSDVLDLKETFVAPNVAGYDLAGIRLLLIEHEGFRGSGANGAIIYFAVDRIEHEHEALVRRGATDAGVPHCVAVMGENETWVGFVEDPFGTVIGLIEERQVAR